MSLGNILYTIIFKPIQLLFEILYMMTYKVIDNPGLSIVILSLAMNLLILPLYRRADAMQEEERETEQRLRKGITHIKKTFKGDERMMILQTYYRQNHYKPTDVFKGSVSLFLEIPFFVAAYQFLSHLELLRGVSFGLIRDLGAADALLQIGGLSVNILPFVMTGVNLISCVIFTKGYPMKTKIQLYAMALFFLVFLYTSPAGLVFYWTLNNLFSLVKTIFYKLKNPQKVIRNMATVLGVVVLVFDLLVYRSGYVRVRALLGIIGVLCLVPVILQLLKNKGIFHDKQIVLQANRTVFVSAVVYMSILIGGLIPTAVLVASPQEFASIYDFYHPLWYVVSSLCLAIGTFVIWMSVFRGLASDNSKRWMDLAVAVACVGFTVNYLLFGKNLGLINNDLVYDNPIDYTWGEQIGNLCVILLLVIVVFLLYRFVPKFLSQFIVLASVVLLCMGGWNVGNISIKLHDMIETAGKVQKEAPKFNLSKNGKNVVIIMLDRALGEVIPDILEERPDIKETYSGFTYYPNTLSFGGHTNIASPALYGGYEYTPYEMNLRADELLVDKHNEALKMMPAMFYQEGFEVTVCDPPYANYNGFPDLSIYEDYPEMHKYSSQGKNYEGFSFYKSYETEKKQRDNRNRNFFCYGMMKCMPLVVQHTLYDSGKYYNSSLITKSFENAEANDNVIERSDLSGLFLNDISFLENIIGITLFDAAKDNTFIMWSNNLTHDPEVLNKPDYSFRTQLDDNDLNGVYHKQLVPDSKLSFAEESQQAHYDSNMLALLEIGKWLEYLKYNGVYDNTRIIIASDHGYGLNMLEKYASIERFYPLLMVKDFNAKEFAVSEEFMTNADVPNLAVDGVIHNPINPFTGKWIDSEDAKKSRQYVFQSSAWNTDENNGKQFLPGPWLSVSEDMRDADNWKVEQSDSVSPLEQVK